MGGGAGGLDLLALDDSAMVKLAVLSNISSQVVADRLIRFLNEDSSDSKLGWKTLPGCCFFSVMSTD
jgi:hypothetical protein